MPRDQRRTGDCRRCLPRSPHVPGYDRRLAHHRPRRRGGMDGESRTEEPPASESRPLPLTGVHRSRTAQTPLSAQRVRLRPPPPFLTRPSSASASPTLTRWARRVRHLKPALTVALYCASPLTVGRPRSGGEDRRRPGGARLLFFCPAAPTRSTHQCRREQVGSRDAVMMSPSSTRATSTRPAPSNAGRSTFPRPWRSARRESGEQSPAVEVAILNRNSSIGPSMVKGLSESDKTRQSTIGCSFIGVLSMTITFSVARGGSTAHVFRSRTPRRAGGTRELRRVASILCVREIGRHSLVLGCKPETGTPNPVSSFGTLCPLRFTQPWHGLLPPPSVCGRSLAGHPLAQTTRFTTRRCRLGTVASRSRAKPANFTNGRVWLSEIRQSHHGDDD